MMMMNDDDDVDDDEDEDEDEDDNNAGNEDDVCHSIATSCSHMKHILLVNHFKQYSKKVVEQCTLSSCTQ